MRVVNVRAVFPSKAISAASILSTVFFWHAVMTCAVMTCVPLALGQTPPAQSGQVILGGTGWTANGKLLARGTAVRGEVSGTPEAGDLVISCGDAWLLYRCANGACKATACSRNVTGNARVKDLGVLDKMAEFLLTREPKEPQTLGVRGGGNPNDAVLLTDAKGVHWGPALNRVLEGKYCFLLAPLPAGPGGAFTLDWDRAIDAEGTGASLKGASLKGVAPGVYRLQKGSGTAASCKPDAEGSVAWVAIADAARYPKLNTAWKQQVAKFAELEDAGVSVAVVTTLRHAALAQLADAK
jgi:hypothetical protein